VDVEPDHLDQAGATGAATAAWHRFLCMARGVLVVAAALLDDID
jgi:hypothetical protein